FSPLERRGLPRLRRGKPRLYRKFEALPLVQFAVPRRDVRRIDSLLRNGRIYRSRRKREFAGIFSRQRDVHELHPDGQGGVGSGLFLSEGFFFVVADPYAA